MGLLAWPIICASCFLFNCRRNNLDCRIGCGACCLALSISSPIPGMPNGKPAGVRCMQLSPDNRCLIYDKPEKPVVCSNLLPLEEMCGQTSKEALAYLEFLEQCTAPSLNPSHRSTELTTKPREGELHRPLWVMVWVRCLFVLIL